MNLLYTKKLFSNVSPIPNRYYDIAPIQADQIETWVNLQIQCWQETYTFMNPFYLKNLAFHHPEWHTDKQKIFNNPEFYKVFLYYENNLIGFCEAGPPRKLPYTNTHRFLKNIAIQGEILRIYILKGHQGQGLGYQLFLSGAQWLQQRAQVPFRVWAFTQNTKATTFYQKIGGCVEKTADLKIYDGMQSITSYCFSQ